MVWRNAGLPTLRGTTAMRRALADIDRARMRFSADFHHVVADGNVVLTDRTDHVALGPVRVDFWVCSTFELREGKIALWHDRYALGQRPARRSGGRAAGRHERRGGADPIGDLPRVEQRRDHQFVLACRVVDARGRQLGGAVAAVGQVDDRDAEVGDPIRDRGDRLLRHPLERGRDHVGVEEQLMLVVDGDAVADRRDHRVAGLRRGVAVPQRGRGLLERAVRKQFDQVQRRRAVTVGHRLHPNPLELDRIDRARGHQEVADQRRVPVLLRCPAVHPAPPRAHRHDLGDLPVVGREVVGGEHADGQRQLVDVAHRRLLRRPVLAIEEGEVAALVPRHHLVRVPGLCVGDVATQVELDLEGQPLEQFAVGQGIRHPTTVADQRIAMTAPGSNQRMIRSSGSRSIATQPSVGVPSVRCMKNAPPLPGTRSLLTPITTAYS